MRGLFENTTLEVVPVTNIARPNPLTLPSSLAQWEMLSNEILAAHDARKNAKFRLATVPAAPTTVHCECALIAFLHNNSKQYSQIFPYIGVSKLSCSLCYNWIEAYNNEPNRPKFYTKGCHGKCYSSWKSPTFAKVHTQKRIDERFTKILQKEFCDRLVDRGLARSRSESDTNASEQYEDVQNSNIAKIRKVMQRRAMQRRNRISGSVC
jgi:nucleic acid/nucleotide deaminase of polymorphic system toxin